MTPALPSNWENWRLGDVGTWYGGGTPASGEATYWDGDIPWVSPKDMKALRLTTSIDKITAEAIENSAAKLIPSGAVLFVTRSGILAHSFPVAVSDVAVTVNQDIKAIKPVDVIDPVYLAWALRAAERKILSSCSKHGTTVHSIEMPRLKELPIPIPPVPEQRRIVAKIEELFSELDKGVESLTTAREQLKAYRQSVLKAAFEGRLTENWRAENADHLDAGDILLGHIRQERDRQYENDIAEWREAVRSAEGAGYPKPRKPSKAAVPDKPSPQQISLMSSIPSTWTWVQIGDFSFVTKLAGFEYTKFVKYDDDGDLEVIKAENAGPKGFRETAFSKIRSDTVAALDRSQLVGGELLMVFVGAGTGNVASVPRGRSFFLGPNIGMMRITSDNVNPLYVEQFLRSPHGRELALSSVKAVAQPSLSMGTIRQIPVALPSLAEQTEIVRIVRSKLEAADVMDAELEAGLARAKALRHSILKRAFSGQLVAHDPADEPASALLERIRAAREEGGTTKRRNNKNGKKEAA
jgi:type I restriction enzyme S subunit